MQNVQLSGRSPQVKKDVLEGSAERPTFWTITQDKNHRRVGHHFYGRECREDTSAARIHHPHDNAIVITLLIADYTVGRVLVDNGSSVDILYYPAFQKINLRRDQLRPVHSPLVGFGGMKVQPVGTITLPMVVGAYPQ